MIIVGAGGHALEVFNEISQTERTVLAFFDEINLNKNELFGLPVKHDFEMVASNDFVLAVGNPALRKKLYNLFIQKHRPANLIANSAQISKLGVSLGDGLNLMHNVYVGPHVSIGKGSLVNAKSSIHHETRIGEFCEICIGVNIAGRCVIENGVFIGMGALILPGLTIGEGSIVGAGAVVTSNVPAGKTVKGIPAK